MHAPAPPTARACALPTCDVALGARQLRFCSRAHRAAAALNKVTEPDTKPCELADCTTIIVRDHGRVCNAEWARRRYCTVGHAREGRTGQPRSPGRTRARRVAPTALPCPIPRAPVTGPERPWRPNAPGWHPDGPRCVAR